MVKVLIVTLGFMFSLSAVAAPSAVEVLVTIQQSTIMDQAQTMGLNWKVGDRADYFIDADPIKGTIVMSVSKIVAEGIWMTQNLELNLGGKQKIETLHDPNTGEIKKMLVNGKEEAPPKQELEVIDVKKEKVTVPAGTFDSAHSILRSREDKSDINSWINPQAVPILGMLKYVSPTDHGDMTIVLKSFKKN